MFDKVLEEVGQQCRAERVPMLGPEKAKLLASCVEKAKPSLIVECGTAIGYSGLWILRVLKTLGTGRLITVEINPDSAQRAREHFAQAGVPDLVDSHIGDAAEVLKTIQDPVDFLFLDNNKDGYFSCFQAIESRLTDPATIVADNVGRADQMADYLEHVRSNYESETHWFESWRRRRGGNEGDNQRERRRDGMEVSIYRR
ncbi:MAG: class I SAM-dependent methyltransferase [Candidatus Poribacteria bacterium]|nr:class I SAM-dependent methyltransferase [Candidatus Poribacteria bacterium]